MENNQDRNLRKPTVDWMRSKYDELNKRLFNGALGPCGFEVFTTGRGSQGKWLGRFSISNRNIRAKRSNRRMFVSNFPGDTLINKSNFADVCKPVIGLNGYYSGTEASLTATLVHEMCHYFNYMDGYCPKQAHGTEFRYAASLIAERSGGEFTVQRVASAEQMSDMKLDAEIKDKLKKKEETRKSRITLIFVFKTDGNIQFLQTTSNYLLRYVIDTWQRREKDGQEVQAKEICTSNDPYFVDFMAQKGYRSTMRTYKYWSIEDKPWVKEIEKFPMLVVYKNHNLDENMKKDIQTIIKEVVDKYVGDMSNDSDSVEVGGIDLGVKSPLEEF